MYRSYRMRYGEDPIGQDPIDGYVDYTPIRITVKMMSGVDHILFTENDNETFLDVKRAVRTHLHKPFHISQLVFQLLRNNGYDYVDDSATIVSSLTSQSHRVIELELLTQDREWNLIEQSIINIASKPSVVIDGRMISNQDRIDALIHGLENNDSLDSLIISAPIYNMTPIMNIVREKTILRRLGFSDTGMTSGEMSEWFDIIGNTNISVLNISSEMPFLRNLYLMNDLVELLRRNTLTHVYIDHADVEIIGDLFDLASVLSDNYRQIVRIRNNRIMSRNINRQELIDSLEHVTLSSLDISDNEIVALTRL